MRALVVVLGLALALIAGIAIGRNVERVDAVRAESCEPRAERVVIGKAAARVKLERLEGRRPRLPREDLRVPRAAVHGSRFEVRR